MVPHDKRKAYESTFGCLLAEILYVTRGSKKFLDEISVFSPKTLFPDSGAGLQFISLPTVVNQELKKLDCSEMKSRITSFVLGRFKRDYDLLRSEGISVEGPDAIVKWLPDDGRTFNSSTVKGLYSVPSPSSDFPSEINPYDYLTAKKIAISSAEGKGFYRSKRHTVDSIKNKLSSIPLISPYLGDKTPLGHPSGGAQVVIENLEKAQRAARRRFHVAIQHDYKDPGKVFEPLITFVPEVPPVNPLSSRHKELCDATGSLFPLPDIDVIDGQVSLHSDIDSIAQGYAPTSEPILDLSLQFLASYPIAVIVDARNTFPRYREDRTVQNAGGVGKSLISSIYSELIRMDNLHAFGSYENCVYYVVLEQPGLPELSFQRFGCLLLICRPQRNNIGADSELLAIRNLVRTYNPNCRIEIITRDADLLARLAA